MVAQTVWRSLLIQLVYFANCSLAATVLPCAYVELSPHQNATARLSSDNVTTSENWLHPFQ